VSEPPTDPISPMGTHFVRGALLVGLANWATYAINFGIAIAVARFLGPEAFGLYAFVFVIHEFISIVNGLCVAPALLQSRDESEEIYDTGYATSFAQGMLGLVIALGVAPLLGAFRSSDASWFILILALTRILNLLTDVVIAKMERHVRYGAVATIHLATRSLPNFLCLALAAIGYGPWSLIIRDLVMALLPFAFSHAWSGYRFHGNVTRKAFQRIMAYSGPMFLPRTLDILLQRFDRLVVGAWFGNTTMGLFQQARFLGDTGLLATTPVSQVTFNMYSRFQDEPARLARAYSIVNYFLTRATFGGAAVLLIYPVEIIRLLLGEEWIAAAPILRILGLYAGLAPLLQNLQILLYARAAVFLNVRLRAVQFAVLLPGVALAVRTNDVAGVALSLLVATFAGVLLAWHSSADVTSGAGRRLFGTPVAALVATVAGFAVLDAAGAASGLPYWSLPFLPAAVFFVLVLAMDRGQLVGEIRMLRTQLRGAAEVRSTPARGG